MPDQFDYNSEIQKRLGQLEKAQMIHERNHSDMSQSVTRIVEHLKTTEDRIDTLETDRVERRVVEAGTGVENKQLRSDVNEIKAFMTVLRDQNVVGKVNSISEGFTKLFWLVIAAIVTGSVGILFLALRGGF